jgi:hypothetical protein
MEPVVSGNVDVEIAAANIGVYTGLVFIVLQTAALLLHWRRLRKGFS